VQYVNCPKHENLESTIRATLDAEGPAICEVMLDLKQGFAPRASSRRLPNGQIVTAPLEDMSPFLSREELAANMLIPLVEEQSPAIPAPHMPVKTTPAAKPELASAR
jgi:acetolactate synthase-1/2/3 large subunit